MIPRKSQIRYAMNNSSSFAPCFEQFGPRADRPFGLAVGAVVLVGVRVGRVGPVVAAAAKVPE